MTMSYSNPASDGAFTLLSGTVVSVGGGEKGYQFGGRNGTRGAVTLWTI